MKLISVFLIVVFTLYNCFMLVTCVIINDFCFILTVAIYLAKRNIRKKGMLEPYEQVCEQIQK